MTASGGERNIRARYLDLLKKCLTDSIYSDPDHVVTSQFGKGHTVEAARRWGLDWPERAHTMIGAERLENVHICVEDVLKRNIPGDLVETGVWRGGACILMRAILMAHKDRSRIVWVADSFLGVPPPNPTEFPLDEDSALHEFEQLAVSRDEVEKNFDAYSLLDDQVRFLEGWFKDALPGAPIEKIALLRLDGDLYESTLESLIALYPKLSPGGYLIVDDYGAIPACRQAVTDYRNENAITEPIHKIDWTGVFWKRSEQ